MKKMILPVVLFFIITTTTTAQTKEELWKIRPTNEFGLVFSTGYISPYKFTDRLGRNIFAPVPLSNHEIGFLYSRRISDRLKFTTGLTLNIFRENPLLSFDTAAVPGSGVYFPSGSYKSTGVPSENTINYFSSVPFDIEYRLTKPNRRHELWLRGGMEFLFLPSGSQYSYSQPVGDSSMEVADVMGSFSGDLRASFDIGLYYAFNISPSSQLRFGVKARFPTRNVYTGFYQFMTDKPQITTSGSITNKLNYIGLTAGYTFNNRRHLRNLLRKHRGDNAYDGYKKAYPLPDTLPDKSELVFQLSYPFMVLNAETGKQDIQLSNPSRLMDFNVMYKRYFHKHWVWSAGIGYKYMVSNTNFGRFETNMIYAPVGISYVKKLRNHWALEAGINIYPYYNLSEPQGTVSFGYNDQGKEVRVLSLDYQNFKPLGFGMQAHITFSKTLRNLDKIYLSLRYDFTPTSLFDIDVTGYTQNIPAVNLSRVYRQSVFSFAIGYGITWKKQNIKLLDESDL